MANPPKFTVHQIDHVELTVPDRFAAAQWYEETLGLKVISEFQAWSDNPAGPLMIGTVFGETKLALFQDIPQGSKRTIGFHLVAFRVDGEQFVEFLRIVDSLGLANSDGKPVTSECVCDHERAYSIYFCDPWGHQLELTTYDHDGVRKFLER